MLDGTELGTAYSTLYEERIASAPAPISDKNTINNNQNLQKQTDTQHKSTMLPPKKYDPTPPIHVDVDYQAPPQFSQQQMNFLMQQQQQQQQQQLIANNNNNNHGPSYINAMFGKKRDILKMLMMAMLILLAISTHSLISFWLQEFVISRQTSLKKELGLRTLYPLAIIFVVWNIKAIFL
jgi:hypothetical protein